MRYFNPEVALKVQVPDYSNITDSIQDGMVLGGQIKQLRQQGILSRLLAQNTDQNGQVDLNKALQSVQANPNQAYQPATINTLSGLIQQRNIEKLKAQQDAIKFDADTNKTYAETEEIKQKGLGKGLENSEKKFGALNQIIQAAALTGSKNNILLGLNGAVKSGIIDPETFDQQRQIVNLMTPEEIKSYASGIVFGNAKDPSSILYQTANNVADNATSTKNNIRTTNATLSGQQVQKEIAQAKIDYDKYILEHKPIGTFVDIDGYQRVEFADGRSMRSIGEDGQPIKAQAKNSTGQPKLSDKALSSVNEMNVQLSTATQNLNKVKSIIKNIEDGKLNLNAASQGGAWLMNRAGLSDENTRGIENFQTALNQAVNDVLMMAKGTQTEGDAQRAAQVIRANPPRDNKAALQVLQRLAEIQQNTIDVVNSNIEGVYQNYGATRPQIQSQPQNGNVEKKQNKSYAQYFD